MSTKSKVVLGMSCVVSLGIIVGVHYKQQLDKLVSHSKFVDQNFSMSLLKPYFTVFFFCFYFAREKMHEGVVRDQAIQEMKRRQNMVALDQQTAITQMLRDQEKQRKGMQ